jgi:hypothetical protein
VAQKLGNHLLYLLCFFLLVEFCKFVYTGAANGGRGGSWPLRVRGTELWESSAVFVPSCRIL